MHNHEPEGYACPFCPLAAEREPEVVLRTERALAFIAPRWWPANPGHVLVIPHAHHENLYDLPPEDGHAVFDATRRVARALRAAYPGCTGVSTRQHNEPDGNQDVFHFHQHVFPRYPDDRLYASRATPDFLPPAERRRYAALLRAELGA